MLDLIRRDPKGSWDIVSSHLQPINDEWARNLLHWLGPGQTFGGEGVAGPLFLFDVDDVLAWTDADPEVRARVIARACPKTLSRADNGTLTRELLIRYGHREDVRNALWANWIGGWCGTASDHHRKTRDGMRQWLSTETSQPVIAWLEWYIDYLGERIKREEIDEERDM
jgi:hypothetical protein